MRNTVKWPNIMHERVKEILQVNLLPSKILQISCNGKQINLPEFSGISQF